ncbi:Large ribosomal subunit protein [Trichinella spiralis]|uniref:Large ribosomal subunit protein n=1 Tax=Trichinella spiralis TaxID=6334 RepID=A0ABR3K4N4_TRISP
MHITPAQTGGSMEPQGAEPSHKAHSNPTNCRLGTDFQVHAESAYVCRPTGTLPLRLHRHSCTMDTAGVQLSERYCMTIRRRIRPVRGTLNNAIRYISKSLYYYFKTLQQKN